MTRYLLDTNHASKVMAGGAEIQAHLENFRESGARFGISMAVLGELYFID